MTLLFSQIWDQLIKTGFVDFVCVCVCAPGDTELSKSYITLLKKRVETRGRITIFF